jgi:hypothetical protein
MSPTVIDQRRDLRLRRRILQVLHAARVHPDAGWMTGQCLVDVIDGATPPAQRFVDDDHARGLLRDLVSAAYAEQRDDRWLKRQSATLELTSYRITHRGVALVEQQIEPDPLVEDERVPRTRPRH